MQLHTCTYHHWEIFFHMVSLTLTYFFKVIWVSRASEAVLTLTRQHLEFFSPNLHQRCIIRGARTSSKMSDLDLFCQGHLAIFKIVHFSFHGFPFFIACVLFLCIANVTWYTELELWGHLDLFFKVIHPLNFYIFFFFLNTVLCF